MGCVSSQKVQKTSVNGAQTQTIKIPISINEQQHKLLKLIYKDLASRSPKGEVTIQNFLLFFHKNGYWGQRLFKQFDTGKSNTITQQQFIKGMIKIFKTTQQKKIQLLYKFFSDNKPAAGISFDNFLKMLYNYPKQDLNKILNDKDFINNEIKSNLVGLDSEVKDRRLESLMPADTINQALNGKAFRLQQTQSNSDRRQSKYGDKLIYQFNRRSNEKQATLKITVGSNDVEIKTTSIHHLVKKYARSIFKNYSIDQRRDTFKYQNFKDWVMHHKNLYNDYYEGFHCQTWEVSKQTNKPLFTQLKLQYSSKAQYHPKSSKTFQNVIISLVHSILIVCNENDTSTPIMLICLEGLAASPIFDNQKGYGFQLTHRDGVYEPKKFFLLNQQVQANWMQHLRFFKGASVNQIYDIKQKIGMGKFSVVYHCIEKATNENYAIKVIQSYKLDQDAKALLAHESSIMSVMSHPLLVFFKQNITTKTHIYIITELVKGKDLFDFVKELKHLEESQAAYVLEQIVIGVRYIHSLGIVHRDLKPENIMLEFSDKTSVIGRIKIIDFGFANYVNNLKGLPKQQLLAGTPNYIAPQILKQQEFDQKIDNFAIGSILYFMLSGTLPFNSTQTATILHKTVQGSYSLNDKRWKNISQQAKHLVEKLLQNEPKDRITLDAVLNHEWINKHRVQRNSKTSIQIHKAMPQKKAQGSASNQLIY